MADPDSFSHAAGEEKKSRQRRLDPVTHEVWITQEGFWQLIFWICCVVTSGDRRMVNLGDGLVDPYLQAAGSFTCHYRLESNISTQGQDSIRIRS